MYAYISKRCEDPINDQNHYFQWWSRFWGPITLFSTCSSQALQVPKAPRLLGHSLKLIQAIYHCMGAENNDDSGPAPSQRLWAYHLFFPFLFPYIFATASINSLLSTWLRTHALQYFIHPLILFCHPHTSLSYTPSKNSSPQAF